VSDGPFHGYFRYYASAWAASVNVQGATVTSPTESLQVIIDRWFDFDATRNVVAPPYLESDLEVDGYFSRCVWEPIYSPITPVQFSRSLLRISVWRAGSNMDVPSFGTIQSSLSWTRPIPKIKNSRNFGVASIPTS
jgi:hypothetical protein